MRWAGAVDFTYRAIEAGGRSCSASLDGVSQCWVAPVVRRAIHSR